MCALNNKYKNPSPTRKGALANAIPGIAPMEPELLDEQIPVVEINMPKNSSEIADLPSISKDLNCPVVTSVLMDNTFELVVAENADDTVDIVANAKFSALFIKDKAVRVCLDNYNQAIHDIWLSDHTPWSKSADNIDNSNLT